MRMLLIAALGLAVAATSASAKAADSLVNFKSPSSNIQCLGSQPRAATSQYAAEPAWVDCMAVKAKWAKVRPRPRDCDEDFFPEEIGLGLARGVRGTSIGSCRGDVGPACYGPSCKVLPYGKSVSIGAIDCLSARNGITCRYANGRRVGFRIAFEGYVTWSQ